MLLAILLGLLSTSLGCQNSNQQDNQPERGVSPVLAAHRAQNIQDVRYDLWFTIPSSVFEPALGREAIYFSLRDASRPVVLDFEPGRNAILSISARGRPIGVHTVNGHIIVPKEFLVVGENRLEIIFDVGDAPLNRDSDSIHTLFAAARARLAFPCFDQPDIKARYNLELTIPRDWQAFSNGQQIRSEDSGSYRVVGFDQTPPVPTYLFAFGAGKFAGEAR
jgi:aminopeptidase N